MQDVFFVYDTSCFYEIVILNYFMSFSNCDMVFCSLDGKPIRAREGFSVNVDMSLKDLDKGQIRSFIIPGGNISAINNAEVWAYLQDLKERDVLLAGICAYVDFAIEVAKKLDMFVSERDLQETVDFWKHYNRVQ